MTCARLGILAALLGSAAWLAAALSGTPLVGYDDANVFFVYARNLVDGHGFVFNPGGERVEGFTSLLWLLICSAARAITPRFEFLLLAVNVALVGAALWSLQRLLDVILRGNLVLSFALTAAVALAPGFVVWNIVSLTDAGLWTALFLIAAVTVLRPAFDGERPRHAWALPVLLALLVLTRPESLLMGPALIAAAMVIRPAFRIHAASIAAFAVTTAALLAWRLAYFGFPLPNTYYATAEPIESRIAAGFDYFSDFAMANPLVPLALAAGLVGTRLGRQHARLRVQPALLLLMAAGCAVPILEGGDRFGFWRLFQPVVPLAAVQAALTAVTIGGMMKSPAAVKTALACGVAILLALVPWRHWTVLDELEYPAPVTAKGIWYTPKVEMSIAGDMRRLGAVFTRAFPDVKPSVAVVVAGGFALTYAGPTIDLLGYNHVAMAHAPGPRQGPRGEMAFQPAAFTAVSPDVLLLSRWAPERDWFAIPMLAGEFDRPAHHQEMYFQRRAISMRIFDYGVLKGLLLRSEAGRSYAWASVRPPRAAGADRWIHAIFNREFLKRIEGRGYEVVFATPPK